MEHRKKNIQILIAFAVFYFAGISVLMVQGANNAKIERENSPYAMASNIVSYQSEGEDKEPLTAKDVEKLIFEKQKLQARADRFTQDGEIDRAKSTYNYIIVLDELINEAVKDLSQ